MQNINKEISEAFAASFFVVKNINPRFDQDVLSKLQSSLLAKAWREFQISRLTLDDYFSANILIARKSLNEDLFIVNRTEQIYPGRKERRSSPYRHGIISF